MALLKVSVLMFLTLFSRSMIELSEADNKSAGSSDLLRRLDTFGLSPRQKGPIENAKNFDRVLDTLLNHSDFQPLVISIGRYRSSLGPERSEIHDIATKSFRDRSLDVYQFNVETGHDGWSVLPIGITWIILIDDREVFAARIREIADLWESAQRFIIFSLDDRQGSADWALFLFRFLWDERRVAKVAISMIDEGFRYVYRYAPFGKIGGEYGRVHRLDLARRSNCDVDETVGLGCPWDVKNSRPIFEDFANFNGYPIRVTVFPSLMMRISRDRNNRTTYNLLDANVMKVIEKHLQANFTVNVHGMTGSADPFESVLRQLDTNGTSECVFTSYFQKPYNGSYSFTTSIFQDKLCLVAPSSKAVPTLFMPLMPFSRHVWLLILTYNFLVVLLWLSMRRLEIAVKRQIHQTRAIMAIELSIKTRRDLARRNCRSLNFATYRPSVRVSPPAEIDPPAHRMEIFHEPPRIHRAWIGFFDFSILACSPLQGGKTNAERAFLFGTLFFSLIVVGLYHSNLISSLSKPMYYPQVRTLRDVANSNRTLFTKYENLMRNVPTDGSPEVEKWRSKIRVLNSSEPTNDIVAFRGMIALSRSSSFHLENLTRYYDPENNRLLLHRVEECLAKYDVAYVLKKNSPYLQRIDDLLLRMRQSGLISKWYNDMLQTAKLTVNKNKMRPRGKRVKLTLAHLSLAFLGLGIGLFFSTLLCFGEIYLAARFRSATARLAARPS